MLSTHTHTYRVPTPAAQSPSTQLLINIEYPLLWMFLCAIVIRWIFYFLLLVSFLSLSPQDNGTKKRFCQSEEAITSINEVPLSAFIRGREVMNKYNTRTSTNHWRRELGNGNQAGRLTMNLRTRARDPSHTHTHVKSKFFELKKKFVFSSSIELHMHNCDLNMADFKLTDSFHKI